ncbi:hypothetical protein RHGRI_035583 [Rhododendron griersonianum]|uniref:RING-type domain-containing protein n=1 Tax=Rhododendron griersonianum TaxID=479676 RepID=A0AAV6HQ06_9ERIC|nr:hypothetical protein RHGRI_035583 [Rhododendron griersonianum]
MCEEKEKKHNIVSGAMDDSNGDENTTSSSSVPCSICLDLVTDNGDRSIAKLQCGHQFHLDCIGSAFNVKGAMQCPNCRKVERGQWLFASGSTNSFPEFVMDDWTPDDYALNYTEMPLGVHWCPFSGLAQVHSSFEEVESASTTYHNLQRHQAIFAEHTSASSVAHSYVAYLGPIPPVSSNANESVEDPNFNHRWNGITGQNEIFAAHGFPVIDVQYQSWGHHSHPFSNSGHIDRTDRASVAPATVRPTGVEYDDLTRFGSVVHPSFHGRGNSRSHERTSASHANGIHHQRQLSNPPGVLPPIIPLVRRSNGPRGIATSQPDQSGGFFNFPPPGPSSRNPHETENSFVNRIHPRERNHLPQPVVSFDWDSVWGPFHHAHGGSSTNRSGNFWGRHRS